MAGSGDLGEVGSKSLYDLLERDGINIRKQHNDCGLMIFERSNQDVHAGGSGCGCAASVLCSKIMDDFQNGLVQNILFMATGALMSPTSSGQGANIPSIAHLVNSAKHKHNSCSKYLSCLSQNMLAKQAD